MEPDFSGYASKNDILCTDGRVIRQGAFAHQDGQKVALVWEHDHDGPRTVLGHAFLENRPDGVYTHAFFNDTDTGKTAKSLVKHGDVNALSIYAKNLVHSGRDVIKGRITEVSLCYYGANEGAKIEYVNLAHGDVDAPDDEAVIFTGLEIDSVPGVNSETQVEAAIEEQPVIPEAPEPVLAHTETDPPSNDKAVEVLETDAELGHADTNKTEGAIVADEMTVQDVLDSMSEEQKNVLYFLVGQAAEGDDDLEHSNSPEGTPVLMTRNLFETLNGNATPAPSDVLSHAQVKSIIDTARTNKASLKDTFADHLAHEGTYGIDNIDVLFPDAQNVTPTPEVIGRRQEWVATVLNGTKHSPFSKIKSTAVDLTADEARAKGYVRASMKKEEVIRLLKRETTPTTIYKKQKLDRDDVLDISDFDVITWLKAEMRVMLDEEVARAILIGDGRDSEDEDKIDEQKIRPIAFDDDMYSHKVTVPSNVSANDTIKSILRARQYYKGTGRPTLFTTDPILTDMLLIEDKMGRPLYDSEQKLADKLRVDKIVIVEPMEEVPNLLGVIVNLYDYTVGSDKGGSVTLFDDFDIDYNQMKYLIETRISGCLTKPKSAIVINRTAGTVITPQAPTYNSTTHVITIPTQAGTVYKIDGVTKTGTVTITEDTTVEADPASGYSFVHNSVQDWDYTF
jgi:HK97 family phage prohead protease